MKKLFSLMFVMLAIIMPMKLWAQEPYAVLTTDTTSVLSSDSTGVTYGKTLTFYYDDQKEARNGMSIELFADYRYVPWYDQCEQITTVVFNDSFANCNSLTSTAFWFYGCSQLTSITGISNLNTDNVTSMWNMFDGCSSLTTLDVSHFNTANVTYMAYMFSGCSKLTSLDLSSFNTDNVTNMGSMFCGCSSLTTLDVSNFNTDNVTSMGEMFGDCSGLTSLDLSSFNTSNVKYMSYMFKDCSSLTSLNISNFNTENVTSMHFMFSGCSSLMGLDLSNFKTDNVISMQFLFHGNSNLTSLDVSHFNTANVTGMRGMFDGCSGLTTLDVSHFNTANVTDMGWMFDGCSGLTTLDLSNFNTANVTDMGCMFEGCSGLTTLDLSNFNTDNVTDMGCMFWGCSSLTSLDVSNFNTANVTSMWNMFYGCSNLTTLDVSNFKTAKVTNMKSMFYGCSGLTSLDVSNFKTDNVTDMSWMFDGCSGLTNLDVSNFNTENVTDMGRMFDGCSGLTTLDVSNFNSSNVTNMGRMFDGCSGLTTLDVSNFNTVNVTNMEYMFYGCSSLTTIYAGNGWSTAAVTTGPNGRSMFYGCEKLVGGAGTTYSISYTNYTYAHIDGGLDNPGYFTAKNQETDNKFSTCAEVGAGEDGKTYRVRGRVKSISNTTFGNWYIEDATDSLYIYGTVDYIGRYPRDGMSWESYGINVGDTVTVQGPKSTYKGVPELVDVRVLSPITLLNVSSNDTAMIAMINRESIRLAPNAATVTAKLYYAGSNCEVTIPDHAQSWLTLQSIEANNGDAEAIFSISDNITTGKKGAEVLFKTSNDSIVYETALFIGQYDLELSPYAVLTTDSTSVLSNDSTGVNYGKTLTFYYDGQKAERNGMDVGPFTNNLNRGWNDQRESITNVVFDASFANCTTLTSTAFWFHGCEHLTEIVGISNLNTDNVTDMSWMFAFCSGLSSLDVSHFNTQNVTNMFDMFNSCSSLTSLDVSGFKTDNVTNMCNMFIKCSNLTNLNVSNFNTSNVTDISGMFSGCSSLTSLDVSNFNTSNVTNMQYIFGDCSGLTSLDVSHFNTENVTYLHGMFSGCSGLTSLDVSGFKTDNVTGMSWLFSGCTGLTSLDVSNFNTSKVTSMSTMFNGCSGLTSLDLSSFNTGNVTSMQSMFSGCTGLTSLDVSNFNTENVTNMCAMFYGCSGLTSLDLSSFNTSNVKYEYDANNYINYSFGIQSMFEGCSALTTIWVGDNWTTANLTESVDVFKDCAALVGGAGTHFDPDHVDYTYAHIDGGVDNPGYFTRSGDAPYTEPEPYVVLSQDSTMLTFYYDDQKTANNGIGIVNQINYYSGETVPWYDSREKVTTVVFDTSFANYKPTTTAMWFYNFLSLTSIMGIENLNTEEVTDMYSMFDECYYLPTIDVSHFNTGKVENMAGMFSECLSLTELDLSNFNTERVKDMSSMFSMLTMMIDDSTGTFVKSQLRSLNISSFNTSNVTDMHQMFRDCSALTSLDLTNFNTGNVTNMEWMLMGLTGLTTIDVSNFDTHNVKNMYGLFWGDSGLATLDLKNFNTTNVTSMKSMFKGCSSLTSIELDNFNTSKVTDMSGMFASCSSLTTIYAGNEWSTASVTNGTDMFKGCSAIKGGKGTTYSETFTIAYGNSTSSDYARIDYKGMPGYFTPKYGYTPEPTYTLEGNVLTIKAPIESSVYYVITDLYSEVDFESADSLRIPETLYTGPLTLDHPVRVRFMAVNGRIAHSEIIVVKYKPIEATFDGRVLAVGGSTTMTDALESVGGRDEVAKTITAIVWNSSATLTNSDLQGLDNPNLLIYVNERSLAPQNRNNVVVNGLAMNVVLSDTGSGNCDFYAPQTFTAEMITYSREFKQATQVGVCRGWETISLPFMVQTIAHADQGVITPFSTDTIHKHFWLRQLSTNGLVSATKIEANQPYLISMPNDEKNYAKEYILKGLVTFSAENAVVPKTEPMVLALADSSVVMMPALQSVGKSSTVWALNVGMERSQYFEGSTFERDYREVRPFEAYTIHRSDTPAPRFLPINDLMNSATGIETISNVIMTHDNYYRLDGRKVDGKPTKKGLYITNGRKVVVK